MTGGAAAVSWRTVGTSAIVVHVAVALRVREPHFKINATLGGGSARPAHTLTSATEMHVMNA